VVGGLSHVLAEEKRVNGFHGVRMGRSINLTHFLFVDDILSFCSCEESNGNTLKDGLTLFFEAMGMIINVEKSSIYILDSHGPACIPFSSLFNFSIHEMVYRFKYLGFNLKPNNYGYADWSHLVA
jgi:hypothetical protein